MTVNTRSAERRPLRFASLSDALADVNALAAGPIRTTGNRSPDDLIAHLADAVDAYIDGVDPATLPWLLRATAQGDRVLSQAPNTTFAR